MAAAGAGGGGGGAPGEGGEEKRGKEIWNVAAFALMMADPFIEGACVCWLRRALDRWTDDGAERRWSKPTNQKHPLELKRAGTELEVGHVAQSASVLGFLLHKLLTARAARARLGLFSDGCVRACF